MYKVILHNRNREIILTFTTEEERQTMKIAIENCINNPDEYPFINYSDKIADIIFTAVWLRESLITFEKHSD